MDESYYREIFSKNLRYYMEINSKSQIDIINDLGFNKSAVSTWVNGTRLPRMDKVDALAKYFHINRSDLIENNKDGSFDEEASAQMAKAIELYEKYKNAIPEIQEAVENLLKASQRKP